MMHMGMQFTEDEVNEMIMEVWCWVIVVWLKILSRLMSMATVKLTTRSSSKWWPVGQTLVLTEA